MENKIISPTKMIKISKSKKSRAKTFTIIVAIILAVVFCGLQALTLVLYNENFHSRFYSDENSGLFQTEDYENLSRTRSDFSSNNKQNLVGYFYSDKSVETYKALVVVSHGFGGGGHISYLPQIEYLARNGYLVYAFDNTGNDESEGKYVKGLPQGPIDLTYALAHVRAEKVGLPIMLYGHSWGAFSALTVLENDKDIKAAVSLSSFNKSKDMLIDQGTKLYGKAVGLMAPFLTICDFFNFGMDSFNCSMDGLENTNANVLLFHSEDDMMIDIKNSFDLFEEKLSSKKNLTFVRMNGKGHDPFLAADSKEYLKQRAAEKKDILDSNNGEWTDELKASYHDSYDKIKGNKLDEEVMRKIVLFYDASL